MSVIIKLIISIIFIGVGYAIGTVVMKLFGMTYGIIVNILICMFLLYLMYKNHTNINREREDLLKLPPKSNE